MLACIVLLLAAVYFIDKYGGWILGIAALVFGLVILSVYIKRHPRLKKVRMKDILQPEARPISGTYKCKACGGTTKIVNELNPSTDCKFCGAPLLDLMFSIQKRNDDMKYEFQRNMAEAEQKNREIYENKLDRLKEESIERSRIRNEKIKDAAIGLGTSLIVVTLIVGLIIIFVVNRLG